MTDVADLLGSPRLAVALAVGDVPVLALDYWLEAPDGSVLALVAFSTPRLDLRQHVQRMADAIVLASAWLTPRESDLREP